MDLSFSRIAAAGAPLPAADLALLVATLAARQEASATALAQAALGAGEPAPMPLLAPATGAFSDAMAARLVTWRNR